MTQYQCPCCASTNHVEISLHADGFAEQLFSCSECEAEWLFKHNALEVIKDSNTESFMSQDEKNTDGTAMHII